MPSVQRPPTTLQRSHSSPLLTRKRPVSPKPTPLSTPSGPSKMMLKMQKTQSQSQSMRRLVSPESSRVFGETLSRTPVKTLQTHGKKLEHTLSKTDLGKTLTTLSSSKDLEGTKDLLSGEVSLKSVRSGTKLTQSVTGSGLLKSEGISEGTGTILAPLDTLCSGQCTVEACQKMWDEPSLENLRKLSTSTLKTISDLKKSLEAIPGGTALAAGLDKLISGSAPGVKLLEMGEKFDTLVKTIETAIEDPSLSNIAKAGLEVVKFTGSSVECLGIPVVSHLASGISDVAGLIQSGIDFDWQGTYNQVSESCQKVSTYVSSCVDSAYKWFGWS